MNFGLSTIAALLALLLLLSSCEQAISANIDRFNLPEIPAQHNVLKQKVVNPEALNKFKQCVANCTQNAMNQYPHDQRPGKQNLEAIQKCTDGCNGRK